MARIDPVADLFPQAALHPHRSGRTRGGRARPTPWSAAGAVALAAVAAMVGGLLAVTGADPAPGTVLAADAMSRDVDGSWGDAPDGGAYTLAASTTSVFAVRNGVGVMDLRRGTSATATLPGRDRSDVRAAAQFSVADLPSSGNGVFASINLRDADRSSYQARARIAPGGRVFVSLLRQDGGPGSLTTLAGQVALPTRVTAEDPVRVEATVTGTSPVQLQLQAWQIDQPDRVVTLSATDTSARRIDEAGALAIWGYVSQGTADAELRIDELSVVAPGRPTPTPPTSSPPTSTSPTSTSPTSTPPTSSAPTTTAPDSSTAPVTTTPPTTVPGTTTPTTTTTTTTTPPVTTGAPTTTSPPSTSPTAPVPGNPPVTTPPPTTSPGTDAGAPAVGTTRYPVPVGALFVSTNGDDAADGSQSRPWRTVAQAATRAPAGATIVVRGGTYHERVVIPNGKRLTIQSYPGEAVWFDGSVPVTSWQPRNGTWVSTGWTAEFDTSQSFTRGSNAGGMVNPAHPLAADPQQLFVDGAQLVQVSAGTRPGPGQFTVDTAADTLTVGSDPTGHSVRASDLTQAFLVAGPLTLRGVGVQRYATPLPTVGTVYFGGASEGSVVEDVVVVDNATQGISIGETDVTLRHVTASRNGMTGIHGNNADRGAVVDSLVEGNNTQMFNRAPSAGGIKVTRTRGFTVDGTVVRDNLDVNGIWLDESVVDFVITRNTVADNGISYGIPIELSANGIVAGNTVTGAQWGLALINSGNVQVFNNYFGSIANNDIRLRQDARREATSNGSNRDRRQPQPDLSVPWLTQDITISNNVLSGTTAGGVGHQVYVLDNQTGVAASAMRITMAGNLFATRRGAGDSYLVGWGAADNRTVVPYTSVQQFRAAQVGGTGPNAETVATGPIPTSAVSANAATAVPLPGRVAEALGVAAGTRFLGP